VVVNVQTNVSWAAGFLIPAVAFAVRLGGILEDYSDCSGSG
jgi:hypothetical protein